MDEPCVFRVCTPEGFHLKLLHHAVSLDFEIVMIVDAQMAGHVLGHPSDDVAGIGQLSGERGLDQAAQHFSRSAILVDLEKILDG